MVEYKVVEFKGEIQLIKCGDDTFLVDPKYLDEFKKEYPDAVEDVRPEPEKKPEPEHTEKKGKSLERMIGERWIIWFFKCAGKPSRSFLDFYKPLQYERNRKKAIRRYVPSAERFPDTKAYKCFDVLIDGTLSRLVHLIPRDVLPIIAEELEFVTAQYEKQAVEANPGYKMV